MTVVNPTAPTFPAIAVPIPTETARHAMVRALMDYIATLRFRRAGQLGEPFQIRRRNLLEEWPDPEHKLDYPSVCVPEGTGTHEAIGLTPQVDEASYGDWAPGTAVVQLAEYAETIQLVVFAADRVERRSILAVLIPALTPSDGEYGLKLRTSADYYERVATFSLVSETMVEDEAIRNQRRADLLIDARVPVVKLQAFQRLRPTVEVVVEQAVSAKVRDEQGGVIIDYCHHLSERGS